MPRIKVEPAWGDRVKERKDLCSIYERETYRKRDRQTYRQKDRQTYRQKDRLKDRMKNRLWLTIETGLQ